KECDPGRELVPDEAHRNGNRRKTSSWGKSLAVVSGRGIESANNTRRIVPGRIDDRRDVGLVHRSRDHLTPSLLRLRARCVTRRANLRHVGVAQPDFDGGMKPAGCQYL